MTHRPSHSPVRPARWPALVVTVTACLVLTSCGDSAKPAPSQEPAATHADSAAQNVAGKAPPESGGFPAIVVLEPIGDSPQVDQAAPPRMDQEQQTFIPPLLLVRTGQPVDFLNHDDVLHNVRVKNGDTKESAFNVAIPTGEKYTHVFKTDGFYDVGCDIHPGMAAQIFSSASPYVVTGGPSGDFVIANVPNGPYKAIAYSGSLKIEKEVAVGPGMGRLELTTP